MQLELEDDTRVHTQLTWWCKLNGTKKETAIANGKGLVAKIDSPCRAMTCCHSCVWDGKLVEELGKRTKLTIARRAQNSSTAAPHVHGRGTRSMAAREERHLHRRAKRFGVIRAKTPGASPRTAPMF